MPHIFACFRNYSLIFCNQQHNIRSFFCNCDCICKHFLRKKCQYFVNKSGYYSFFGVANKLRQVTANAFILTFWPFVNVNLSDFTDYGRLWQAKTRCFNHTQVLKEIIYPEWGLSKTLGINRFQGLFLPEIQILDKNQKNCCILQSTVL